MPGEILLACLFAGILGQVEEQTARLPFALAGVARRTSAAQAIFSSVHLHVGDFAPRPSPLSACN